MANIIVGVMTPQDMAVFDKKMNELRELARALDLDVDYEMVQNLKEINQISYLGKGKVEELKKFIDQYDIDYVIFNDELTSNQYNFLSDMLEAEILDRTSLILAIFEKRARTREAVLQVQIAKLNYQLPRLIGGHKDLIGQLGGSGFRGAGETQLELDRRQLYRELHRLKQELQQVVLQRQTQRQQRKNGELPVVALVGYTNSGKSTLMNAFLKKTHHEDKSVFEKDMLFATLETSTRIVDGYGQLPFLLTDTVGFIAYLPHVLVQAFKSTLEEIKEADLLLHVIDASDPDYLEHVATTMQVLEEIGAKDIPMLYLYNKVDLGGYAFVEARDPHLFISAKNNINMDALQKYIRQTLYPHVKRVQLMIPYEDGEIFSYLNAYSDIITTIYQENGIYVVAEMLPGLLKKVEKYYIAN